MLYEFKDGKIMTKAVEYSVAYHCNLKCAGCSHMAPFLGRKFPPVESFAADVNKLSKGLHASDIRLVGGEPLLNPEIDSFIKIAKASKIADTVMVTTNGLLLHKMKSEFWENVDFVSVTLYPDALPSEKYVEEFKERAQESKTRLRLFPNPVFRTTLVTRPHPKDWITDTIFRTCKNAHLYHCHMIHEGRLYKCAAPPFLPEYLSRMGASGYDPAVDAFEIHEADGTFGKLRDFLVSSATMDACRFCLGHVGKFQPHSQLKSDYISHPDLQSITRGSHLDAYKFLKEWVRYYRRRVLEKMTKKQLW
jgi:organic radical activating enzyme